MNLKEITNSKLTSLLGRAARRGYEVCGCALVVTDDTTRDIRIERALGSYNVPIVVNTSLSIRKAEQERRMELERLKRMTQMINDARTAAKRASRTKIAGKLLGTMPVTEFDVAYERYITTLYSFQ